MNLPKAFFTSRVTEALASLAVHVTSAQKIAASLKPIKTAALDLEEEEKPRPIFTLINPRTIDPSTTKHWPDVCFTIYGKNLAEDSVRSFELFLEDDPTVSFNGTAPSPLEDDKGSIIGFTADVNLEYALSGSYEVRITDKNDTPHLPGFTVEIKAVGTARRGIEAVGTPRRIIEPPTITDQPRGQRVNPGALVILTVVASGSEPFSYQWLKDGNPIAGETSKDLEISAEENTDYQANYSVVVANSAGFAVSTVAELKVNSGMHS